MSISTRITHCRVCDTALPAPFLDLGRQPLANNLLSSLTDDEPRVRLELCHCPACELVQLTETVKPDVLFRDYVWVSGTAQTTRDYANTFCQSVLARVAGSTVLNVSEVASNDGTFLKPFASLGHRVKGIDPARNIAAVAEEAGIPTYAEFFGMAAASYVLSQNGPSDVVIARNVIPHVADVNDVIAGMAHLLKADGTGVIEFHDASIIQKELHYDSVYHEHLFYFTLTTLENLLARHGLRIFDITQSPISGGSVVVYFSLTERAKSDALLSHLAAEKQTQTNSSASWQTFARACEQHKAALHDVVSQYVEDGAVIVGYGASARSSTMLNYCGLDHHLIACISDQNPMKHNRLTPGTHIPIGAPAEMMNTVRPDVVLLLAWNFADEIIAILRDELEFNGDIIQPLPYEVSVKCK